MSLSLCFRKAIIRLGRDQLSRQKAKHFVLAKASEDCLIKGRAACSRASFVTSRDSAVSLGWKTSGPCEMEGVVSDTNERYCHLLPSEPALGEGEGTNRVLPPHPGPAFPLIIIETSPVFSI